MLKLHVQQKKQFVEHKAEVVVKKASYLYGFHVSVTTDFLLHLYHLTLLNYFLSSRVFPEQICHGDILY